MKSFKQIIEMERIKLTGKFGGTKPSEEFMDELHDTTSEHPFDEKSRVFGNHASLHISRDGSSSVRLHDIRSLHPGGGSKALDHIKALADKHGVTISGHAKAYSKSSKYPMSTKELGGYYKKRGFSVGPRDEYGSHPIEYTPKKTES